MTCCVYQSETASRTHFVGNDRFCLSDGSENHNWLRARRLIIYLPDIRLWTREGQRLRYVARREPCDASFRNTGSRSINYYTAVSRYSKRAHLAFEYALWCIACFVQRRSSICIAFQTRRLKGGNRVGGVCLFHRLHSLVKYHRCSGQTGSTGNNRRIITSKHCHCNLCAACNIKDLIIEIISENGL